MWLKKNLWLWGVWWKCCVALGDVVVLALLVDGVVVVEVVMGMNPACAWYTIEVVLVAVVVESLVVGCKAKDTSWQLCKSSQVE